MERRKLILKLLLWSLGVAAAAGAAAVLLPLPDVVEHVMLTGLATGAAAGLALPVSLLLEKNRARHAGLVGMCLIVADFLIVLILIWLDRAMSNNVAERFAFTLGFLTLTGVPATLFLWLGRTERGRIAGPVGVVVATTTFLLFMFGVWVEPYIGGPSGIRWGGTGATVGIFGVMESLILIGVGVAPRRTPLALGLVGLAVMATFVGAALMLLEIWDIASPGEETLATGATLATFAAHTSLIWLIPLKRSQTLVRVGTTAFAAITTVLVIALVAMDGAEMVGRLTASSGIVAACGTMALLVFVAVNRRTAVEAHASELSAVALVCPNCSLKQELAVGRSACTRCGLGITIRIDEPRCSSCEHLLYGITSGRCPECGKAVGAQIP